MPSRTRRPRAWRFGFVKFTRRHFLVASGLFAIEVALEMQGHGVVAVTTSAIPRLLEGVTRRRLLDMGNTELDVAYDFFTPELQSYLRRIPIVVDDASRTASCYPKGFLNRAPFIAVSPDFFGTAGQSSYWEEYYSKPPYSFGYDQPVFGEEFRINLLAHELLHIAEVHLRLDMGRFFHHVEDWYRDEVYGRPTQDEVGTSGQAKSNNKIKRTLWWYLYGFQGDLVGSTHSDWKSMEYCNYYQYSLRGCEEFAYIGAAILVPTDDGSRRDRLRDLSDYIIDSYGGIIDVSILDRRPSAGLGTDRGKMLGK